MRVSDRKLNKSLQKQIQNVFAQTIADIKTVDEAHKFFKDFLTDAELETFSKRLAVAYWLQKGRSYANIKTNLKVSSATIATVADSLKSKGVQLALKKIEADEWANVWSDRIKKFLPSV